MHIERLTLSNFRSHADLMIDATPGFVAISGANGAGKTNILEAVSLLSPGRGMRGVAFADMVRQTDGGTQGTGGFGVAAQLRDPASADILSIGTAITADAPRKRIVQINSAPASASRISEWLAVVWLTPAMDRLFSDTAGARRRFIDRLVLALEPGHAQHVTRYEAAMRARNSLLAGEVPPDPAWLGALEVQMAQHGTAIDAARRRLIDDVNAAILDDTGGFLATPALALAGDADGISDAALLTDILCKARAQDATAGRTLCGPHRSDLIVTHMAKAMPAASSSTGEQKAMLIRIILAHADLVAGRQGRALLLLLDEVAAHLDPDRRIALYARLAETRAQVWMTGTDAALFNALPGAQCHVHLNA